MRVSYEWIKELVDISATPEKVADTLTMIGLEVEGAESVHGDIVFEVNVTPNRPDCLSMIGVARELSAAFNIPVTLPPHEPGDEQHPTDFTVEIQNTGLCNRYAGRVITGVSIADSPDWLRMRLEKCGIRSINNVVDITNYVLLEFGHPLHAFDADTVEGRTIKVDVAGNSNRINTLDGVERALSADALLIWDSMKPIAIAGIMGGAETEVTGKTKNIFLESAYFDPSSIRKTSKKLGLVSESSYRFERGVDIEFLEKALNRAALMIKEITGGNVSGIIDVYPVQYRPEAVSARFGRIKKILGISLSDTEMLAVLKRLRIPFEEKKDGFIAYPPAHRRDIIRDSDIAEEIARIFGYDSIPLTNPKTHLSSGPLKNRIMNISKLRDSIRKSGFTEVINFSFMAEADLDMIGIPPADERRKTVPLSNPLSQDASLLRTTLVPALLANLKYNLDRAAKDIRLFELSKVFINTGNGLPAEELRLGGIFFRDRYACLWKDDVQGFFITKGALESLFQELKILNYTFSPSSETFLQTGRTSEMLIAGSPIGYVGVLGPDIIEKLDLKKQKPEIVLFELSLDKLFKHAQDSIQYMPVPRYPAVERDIALVLDDTVPSSQVQEIIMSYATELIEEVSVFDSYKGKNIPEGKKSLAFNIIYRSKERTLRDEEVETLHSSVVEYLKEKTGGEQRQ